MKLLAAAALSALVLVGGAHAADFVPLPSPVAPLSPSPPLAGGATASGEGVRHRINAQTRVDVALDPNGTPFRVRATQKLDVRVKGDYFFTVGAPVLAVEAAPGSASTPGLRSTSIVWAGFNPGRRTLIAHATLRPGDLATPLPVRIAIERNRVTLVNQSAVTAGAFRADVVEPSLRAYFAQLRREVARGATPTGGGALVTTKPEPTMIRVQAPFLVTGTVGAQRVHAVLEDSLSVNATGPVRLTVTPLEPARLLGAPIDRLTGRQLLHRLARATLTLARVRQYRAFLGNPDTAGRSGTTYVYRTAAQPALQPAAVVDKTHRSWPVTLAVVASLLVALSAAAFAWSRS
jgi:hypothetical protein